MIGKRRMLPFPGIQAVISRGFRARCDAEQGAEGVERVEAPIEAEHIFVEIGLEVMLGDIAVIGPKNPRLEMGNDQMNHR